MEIWLADVNREWKKRQQKTLKFLWKRKKVFIKEILLCVGMFFVIFSKHATTIVGHNSFIAYRAYLSVDCVSMQDLVRICFIAPILPSEH